MTLSIDLNGRIRTFIHFRLVGQNVRVRAPHGELLHRRRKLAGHNQADNATVAPAQNRIFAKGQRFHQLVGHERVAHIEIRRECSLRWSGFTVAGRIERDDRVVGQQRRQLVELRPKIGGGRAQCARYQDDRILRGAASRIIDIVSIGPVIGELNLLFHKLIGCTKMAKRLARTFRWTPQTAQHFSAPAPQSSSTNRAANTVYTASETVISHSILHFGPQIQAIWLIQVDLYGKKQFFWWILTNVIIRKKVATFTKLSLHVSYMQAFGLNCVLCANLAMVVGKVLQHLQSGEWLSPAKPLNCWAIRISA